MGLKFNEAARAVYLGVPNRDLTDEEVTHYGESFLLSLKSGHEYLFLKEEPSARRTDAGKREVKHDQPVD